VDVEDAADRDDPDAARDRLDLPARLPDPGDPSTGARGPTGGPQRTPPDVAIAVAWFPAGEYEQAIARWPSLAEDWTGVAHAEYSRRMDGNIKWMRAHGVMVRAVAPIVVEELVAWCDEHDEDPEAARAAYAAEQLRLGRAIDWPPGRNARCWCGSQRKYKHCCGRASAAPMHDLAS
jgi:hypothetical protein